MGCRVWRSRHNWTSIWPTNLSGRSTNCCWCKKAKDLDIKVDDDLKRPDRRAPVGKQDYPIRTSFTDLVREQTGMSYEDFVQIQKNTLLTNRVVEEEVWRNIVIPDADIQQYYDAHKADFVRKESRDAARDHGVDRRQ